MEKSSPDKSKTRIKREAEALQKLGEKLIKLPRRQLERMDLPTDLLTALIDAKSIKSHIAARRQRQFIGTLMREIDPAPIREALLAPFDGVSNESEFDKTVKRWMDRLMAQEPAAIEAFLNACPEMDRQQIRQMTRNAKKEKATGKATRARKKLEHLVTQRMDRLPDHTPG